MKNILKSVFILFSALAISCSTDDVEDRPIIEGVDSPVLSAPDAGSAYVLNQETMDQQAERFVWSKANYNGDVAISYTLEMDVEGGDFSAPQSLGGTTGALQFSVTEEALNTACLSLGATPFEASSYDVRVVSSASGFDMMASNKVTIIVTPYTTELPKVYTIGNFLSASGYGSDWSPAASLPALASSGFGKTDFEGYVYMNVTAPEFKILPTNTSFDGDFGDDGTFSGALAQEGESNILLSAPGYYRVQANTGAVSATNLDGLKYSTTAVSWGIIGAATPTGWDSDTDMTFNPTTKKWEIIIALTVEKFKFRYNDTWNNGDAQFNLGLFDATKTGQNYGGENMSYGGGDISVTTAGTYLVELDLSNPRDYKFTMTLQ